MGIFLNQCKRTITLATLGMLCAGGAVSEQIQVLSLDVISYEDFLEEKPQAMAVLKKALLQKGIVGIKGVTYYKELVQNYIQASRAFFALPEYVKEAYAPQFKRSVGTSAADDLKESYYAYVPDCCNNKWPREVILEAPFEELGDPMSQMGQAVMKRVGLIGPNTRIGVDGIPQVGKIFYYDETRNTSAANPFWRDPHFDHGLFTVLIPAVYFVNGRPVQEPIEAGLFVKTTSSGPFQKVVVNDPDVMLFQVGEFGQLATNDAIKATQYRIDKASSSVERYSMALYFDAKKDAVIHSTSVLTSDPRYGAKAGGACTYQHWQEESNKLSTAAPSGK